MNDKKEILEEIREKILAVDLIDPGNSRFFLKSYILQMVPYIPDAVHLQNELLNPNELQRKLIDLIDNFK